MWTPSHGRAKVEPPARSWWFNISVPIQDVVWKTSQEWLTIETGGDRESGRSVLTVRHDDDNDDLSQPLPGLYDCAKYRRVYSQMSSFHLFFSQPLYHPPPPAMCLTGCFFFISFCYYFCFFLFLEGYLLPDRMILSHIHIT